MSIEITQEALDKDIADLTEIVTALYTKDEKTGLSPMEAKFSEPAKTFDEALSGFISATNAKESDKSFLPDRLAGLEEDGLNPKGIMQDFLKENGLENTKFEYLFEGSNAVMFRGPVTKECPFGMGLRITADPKEPDRLKDPSVIPAITGSKKDGLTMEIVPIVVTDRDIYKQGEKMGFDRESMDKKFATAFSVYLSDMSGKVFDTDPGNTGNLAFALDRKGSLSITNLDPGAVVEGSTLKEKKLQKISGMKEEFSLPEGLVNPIDNKSFSEEFAQEGLSAGLEGVKHRQRRDRINGLREKSRINAGEEVKDNKGARAVYEQTNANIIEQQIEQKKQRA